MAASQGDHICESWEDIDEEQLSMRFNLSLSPNDSEASESQKSGDEATTGRKTESKATRVVIEDNNSLNFFKEPSIKILKRPTAGNSGDRNDLKNGLKTAKTLEQRQREYEEKRLRILGEAKCKEDIIDDGITQLQLSKPSNQQANTTSKEEPIKVIRIERPMKHRIKESRDNFNILRQPEGPNAQNKGFKLRR